MSVMATRAYYRGCPGPAWNRTHIVNDAQTLGGQRKPGSHAWCGQVVRSSQFREPYFLSPLPATLPSMLTWCAPCIGRYAEYLGLLADVAESVVTYDPSLTDPHQERWWDFVDAQREVRRERLARGQR